MAIFSVNEQSVGPTNPWRIGYSFARSAQISSSKSWLGEKPR